MRPAVALRHVFVDSAPDRLDDGVIYVSIRYRTVMHKCCCGCGSEVVTPIGPTDWTLIFDGVSVSLDPSIGNWSLACRSHYVITQNRAKWAGSMSQSKIDAGRKRDRDVKDAFYQRVERAPEIKGALESKGTVPSQSPSLWWQRMAIAIKSVWRR